MYHYGGDVKAASNSGTLNSAGTAQLVPVGQRSRLRSVLLAGPTGQVTFLNGSAGGSDSMFSIVTRTDGLTGPFQLSIPGHGVLFDNGISVLLTSASANYKDGTIAIFYEG
tara:strand:+ start:78 stop:410 length:333 start_codon:yes stop_codon:yes gene_type:complete